MNILKSDLFRSFVMGFGLTAVAMSTGILPFFGS